MTQVSFQVVEGIEAGRIFRDLTPPVTIGREDDNDIQLNDERISRFHAKIQEEAGRVILTDLDSTNGTRVNGHPIRLRVLRNGDLIMIGRCVLLMGGPEEYQNLRKRLNQVNEAARNESGEDSAALLEASDLNVAFPTGTPPVPEQLTPLQTAELVDLLEYYRTNLLNLLTLPTDDIHTTHGDFVRLHKDAWIGLQSLLPEFTRMLNQLNNVDEKQE
ncbi:FHA domain-containing protein [Planctomicrobium sp. SH668]|uniref:FHA domain-containing protein n=1 Tax=Planctomicrobium sp. SH668 TaxID=3448126 RepID=UPI003F5C807A